MMFCSSCRCQLPDDVNFCMKCGQVLNEDFNEKNVEKWEYQAHLVRFNLWSSGYDINEFFTQKDKDGKTGQQVIEDYGKKGWELISANFANESRSGNRPVLMMFFKRRLP